MTEYEQVEMGKFREGETIMMEDRPCKIVEIKKSKPGKHGEAKARMMGVDIFNQVKRTVVKPVKHKEKKPILTRHTGTFVSADVQNKKLQLIDLETYEMVDNVQYDPEKTTLEEGSNIILTYIVWEDEKMVIASKKE